MYNSACEAHCRYGAGVVVLTWLRQTSSLGAGAPPPIAPAEQIPVRGQTEKNVTRYFNRTNNMSFFSFTITG